MEETLNLFNKASIILIPLPHKDSTKKKKKLDKYPLMNTEVKILNKISVNQIQQYIKRITRTSGLHSGNARLVQYSKIN